MRKRDRPFVAGIVTIAILAAVLVPTASAGDREDELLQAMTEAYGGKRLMEMKTYTEEWTFSIHWQKQDWRPGTAQIRLYREFYAVDFEHGRGAREYFQEGFGSEVHGLLAADGDTGHAYDFMGRHSHSNMSFGRLLNRVTQFSVPILVRRMHAEGAVLAYKGTEEIDGAQHNVLSVQLPEESSSRLLYVNADSNLISKIRPESSNSRNDYNFGRYRRIDGITQPTYVRRETAGNFSVSMQRMHWDYSINADISKYMSEPSGFTPFPELDPVDDSKMTVTRISDNVYHVGRNGGHSIFIDTGEYIIASGGYAGLKERFEAFKSASGVDKPLKYQVVSHHHDDHVRGMKEALDLGATLVTVRDHVPSIVGEVGRGVPEDRFLLVDGKTTLAADTKAPVQVTDIQTGHVEHMLMLYLPWVKVLFVADHVGSNTRESYPPPNRDRTQFYELITRMGLDVEKFVPAHSARILSLEDVRAIALQKFPERCYENRPICAQ